MTQINFRVAAASANFLPKNSRRFNPRVSLVASTLTTTTLRTTTNV